MRAALSKILAYVSVVLFLSAPITIGVLLAYCTAHAVNH